MKTIVLLFVLLLPLISVAQFQTEEEVIVSKKQNDDIYLAGGKVAIKARVDGDVVIAAGEIRLKDSISQDLIAAGGEVTLKGYVYDDIRIVGGSLTIDNEIGDDLVAFGGKIRITEDAVIRGNLVSCAGDLNIDGKIMGIAKICAGDIKFEGRIADSASFYGGDIKLNGEILGKSKIIAESIEIGDDAKFYTDVEYWSEKGEIDFKNSLVNASAIFNEDLAPEEHWLSWGIFSATALGFWIFYILSAFLLILVFNFLFKKLFSEAIEYIDKEVIKSFGYGMAYLIGVPFLIVLTFLIVIGIPLGVFLTFFYVFSLLFGHLVAALLIVHYLNKKNNKSWNFWTITLFALAITLIIRLITFIPILGGIISLVSIGIGYGLIAITLLQNKASLKMNT